MKSLHINMRLKVLGKSYTIKIFEKKKFGRLIFFFYVLSQARWILRDWFDAKYKLNCINVRYGSWCYPEIPADSRLWNLWYYERFLFDTNFNILYHLVHFNFAQAIWWSESTILLLKLIHLFYTNKSPMFPLCFISNIANLKENQFWKFKCELEIMLFILFMK